MSRIADALARATERRNQDDAGASAVAPPVVDQSPQASPQPLSPPPHPTPEIGGLSQPSHAAPEIEAPSPPLQPASEIGDPSPPLPQQPDHFVTNSETIRNHMVVEGCIPNTCGNEEYKKVMEVVLKSTESNPRGSVVLVTSANPQEGKSVTSINLAINIARHYDHTVLLMDCDFRRPSCHRYLGIDASVGIADCLQGKQDIASALIKTNIGRLTLFPAGQVIRDPVELVSSRYMRALLHEVKNRYADRYIIVDTPPILMYAETRFLASLSDVALLVVREGKTTLEDATESSNLLGDKLLGAVYNGAVSPPLTGQKDYSYYTQSSG